MEIELPQRHKRHLILKGIVKPVFGLANLLEFAGPLNRAEEFGDFRIGAVTQEIPLAAIGVASLGVEETEQGKGFVGVVKRHIRQIVIPFEENGLVQLRRGNRREIDVDANPGELLFDLVAGFAHATDHPRI